MQKFCLLLALSLFVFWVHFQRYLFSDFRIHFFSPASAHSMRSCGESCEMKDSQGLLDTDDINYPKRQVLRAHTQMYNIYIYKYIYIYIHMQVPEYHSVCVCV